MGMPRRIAEQYEFHLEGLARQGAWKWAAFCAEMINEREEYRQLWASHSRAPRSGRGESLIRAFMKNHYRLYAQGRFMGSEWASPMGNLERHQVEWYVGLGEGGAEPAYRTMQVCALAEGRVRARNARLLDRDRPEIERRRLVARMQGRVYASRTFPPTLRQLIFRRDNYTCQICLRDRERLLACGLHLEADHVVAWIDGGQTTYGNGQTLCSECNIAKHHAKPALV